MTCIIFFLSGFTYPDSTPPIVGPLVDSNHNKGVRQTREEEQKAYETRKAPIRKEKDRNLEKKSFRTNLEVSDGVVEDEEIDVEYDRMRREKLMKKKPVEKERTMTAKDPEVLPPSVQV